MTWPYTMTTPYWSYFVQNSTFNQILRGFHRTFATGVACWQGKLTPPDNWSRPVGTCICSTCWGQSYFRTCRYFLDYCLRISLGISQFLLWRQILYVVLYKLKYKYDLRPLLCVCLFFFQYDTLCTDTALNMHVWSFVYTFWQKSLSLPAYILISALQGSTATNVCTFLLVNVCGDLICSSVFYIGVRVSAKTKYHESL